MDDYFEGSASGSSHPPIRHNVTVTADLTRRLEESTVNRSMDFVGDIIDEIALEGLDGITLQGLWERLKLRPGFMLTITDEAVQNYIWTCVKKSVGLQFFELPTSRPILTVYNRNDFKDERGNVYEPVTVEDDIYTYNPIDDKKNRIRGSCLQYTQRNDITGSVRRLNCNQAFEKYGNRLVIVASQNIREKAIFPPDTESHLDMTIIQYCMIERIARARYPGEGTRGKISLSVMKIDPKSLFYQRKLLIKKKLIMKQASSVKFGEGRISCLISILHIPRFYTRIESTMVKNMNLCFVHLKQQPHFREETAKMKRLLGKFSVQTILHPDYSDIFHQTDMSYADLRPDEMEKEKNPVKQETYRRKFLRVIILKKPDINFIQYCRQKLDEKEEVEAELENNTHFVAENLNTQTTVVYRIQCHVINSGPKGSTLREIAETQNISFREARTACRSMVRHKVVCTVLEDLKKTKVTRYVWFKFKNANVIYQQLGSQGEKNILSILPNPIVPGPEEEFTYWTMVDGSLTPQLVSIKGTETTPSPLVTTKAMLMLPLSALAPIPLVSSCSHSQTWPALSADTVEDMNISHDSYNPEWDKDNESDDDGTGDVENDEPTILDMDHNDTSTSEFNVKNTLHFSKGEENLFGRVEGKDGLSFSYETAGGWEVAWEPADIKVELGKTCKTFSSMRNLGRGNYIVEMIYKQTLILGFQQILRAVRRHEAKLKYEEIADRRSLFRILKQLQIDQRLQMWRISVSNGTLKRICPAFTPGDITENSPLLVRAVDSLIQSVIRTAKLSKDEKKQRQKKFSILRKSAPIPLIGKTRMTAKPGRSKNTREFLSIRTKRRRRKPPTRTQTCRNTDAITAKFKLKHDEVDKQALARLNKLRGDWSPDEDRHALCLFISSVLFIPRYNLDRIFVFNASQIRDIMHSRLEESRSKTSTAVRRRLHFLMRRKGFFAKYRYYLNTALDDVELRSEIVNQNCPKDGPPEKLFYEIPTEALIKVFDYLMNLFTNSQSQFKLDDDVPVVASKPTMTSSEYQELDQIHSFLPEDDNEDSDWAEFDTNVIEEYQTTDEFYDETKINPNEVGNKDDIAGVTVLKVRDHGPVIVDGNDDPCDKLSVDIWTARTSLLSIILSGETLTSHTISFLDSVTDDVLDFVVQNLRCLGITSNTKPEKRFTISAGMKRKLQSHLTTNVFRQCYEILEELRGEGSKFDVTPELCIPAFFFLADFTMKHEMNFTIQLPESVITLNEKWQDLFSSVDLNKDNPKKCPPMPPFKPDGGTKHHEQSSTRTDHHNPSRKRKAETETCLLPESEKSKRKKIEINNESTPQLRKKFETPVVNAKQMKRIDSDEEAYKKLMDEMNIVFSGGRKTRILDEDCESTCSSSSSLKDLVLNSSSQNNVNFVEENMDESSEDEVESADPYYIVPDHDSDSETEVTEEGSERDKAHSEKITESLKKPLKKCSTNKPAKKFKTDTEILSAELDEKENGERRSTPETKGRLTNKMLRTLRSQLNATAPESRLIENDFFFVNLPKISTSFSVNIDDILYDGPCPGPASHVSYIQKLLINCVPGNCMTSILDPKSESVSAMGRYSSLYDLIEVTEEVGISIPYLLTKFDRDFVSTGLGFLVNGNYVYMVGVQYRRFIAACHTHKWTLPIPTQKGSTFSERVIMRPWITSIGLINWPVVTQFFASLIGCLNTNPSIRVRNLCRLLQPMLSSVETMILVEALSHMDFVKLYSLAVSHEPTLFSESVFATKHTQMDEFLDMEFLYIELKPFATAKFADLQETLHPTASEENTFRDVLAE